MEEEGQAGQGADPDRGLAAGQRHVGQDLLAGGLRERTEVLQGQSVQQFTEAGLVGFRHLADRLGDGLVGTGVGRGTGPEAGRVIGAFDRRHDRVADGIQDGDAVLVKHCCAPLIGSSKATASLAPGRNRQITSIE